MNLYEELEVPKNASADIIKKAYKHAAGKHHPDKGGSVEKFKQVKLAYEVLSDESRRQRYDVTGAFDNKPDNTENEIMANIAHLILNIVEQTDDIATTDITGNAIQSIKTAICQTESAISDANYKIEKFDSARCAIKRINGGDNIIADIIESKIDTLKAQIIKADCEISKMECMIEILEEYETHFVSKETISTFNRYAQMKINPFGVI